MSITPGSASPQPFTCCLAKRVPFLYSIVFSRMQCLTDDHLSCLVWESLSFHSWSAASLSTSDLTREVSSDLRCGLAGQGQEKLPREGLSRVVADPKVYNFLHQIQSHLLKNELMAANEATSTLPFHHMLVAQFFSFQNQRPLDCSQ